MTSMGKIIARIVQYYLRNDQKPPEISDYNDIDDWSMAYNYWEKNR